MNERQRTLVQESFGRLVPVAALAADLFYARLFQLAPGLRPRNAVDLQERGHELMRTISDCVSHPDQAPLLPAVEEVCWQQGCDGVKDGRDRTVGEALLWTLERGLGQAFTPEVREAWTALLSPSPAS
jgi:nitric oxide dioxygenase